MRLRYYFIIQECVTRMRGMRRGEQSVSTAVSLRTKRVFKRTKLEYAEYARIIILQPHRHQLFVNFLVVFLSIAYLFGTRNQ